MVRNDGRRIRAAAYPIQTGFAGNADSSALIEWGRTRVLCTAMLEERFRRFAGNGPGMAHCRVRDAARLHARSQGAQRLFPTEDLPRSAAWWAARCGWSSTLPRWESARSDRLRRHRADGGTRTASVTAHMSRCALLRAAG